MKNETPSYDAFCTVFLDLLQKNGVPVTEQTRVALKRFFNDLALTESEGGLCVEWTNNPEYREYLEALIRAGLLTEGHDLNGHLDSLCKQALKPFVVDRADSKQLRIYSHRAFLEESRLASAIADLAQSPAIKPKEARSAFEKLEKKAQQLHQTDGRTLVLNPLQRKAADLALTNHFSVICGGPGTGKTTSVIRFLEAALEVNPGALVTLCAPTGKAKSRLTESVIGPAAADARLYPNVREAVSEDRIQSFTIHKLLTEPLSDGRRPSPQNPLESRILIIDEGSMIDSQLARNLFSVIDPETTQTILLGDKHQLAAVGPGSVFADLSDAQSPLSPFICELQESMRFNQNSAIGRVAGFILGLEDRPVRLDEFVSQVEKERLDSLKSDGFADVGVFFDAPERFTRLSKPAARWLEAKTARYAKSIETLIEVLQKTQPLPPNGALTFESLPAPIQSALKEAWDTLSTFRPICAQRQGPNSLQAVNDYCDNLLRRRFTVKLGEDFFTGKVIIVRKNDPSGISNGDVCILFPLQFDGENRPEWFAFAGDIAKIFPAQLLPNFDTAFAITIHQSQGSGFDDVAVFLPYLAQDELQDSQASSLCTRELIYTGFTRTKKTCQIFSSRDALALSLNTVTHRSGGLADRLNERFGRLI